MQETNDIPDFTDFITNYHFRMDFDLVRDVQLSDISQNIFNVLIYVILPIFGIHIFVTICLMMKDKSFKKLPILEKSVHIICNLFLVLPHRDIDNNNSEADHIRNRSLLLLHCLGNIVMLYASKLYYYELEMKKIFRFPL